MGCEISIAAEHRDLVCMQPGFEHLTCSGLSNLTNPTTRHKPEQQR
jgi:hypothetical protein